MNFLGDEEIASCIKKYPCLYDTTDFTILVNVFYPYFSFSSVLLFLSKITGRSIKLSSSSLSILFETYMLKFLALSLSVSIHFQWTRTAMAVKY